MRSKLMRPRTLAASLLLLAPAAAGCASDDGGGERGQLTFVGAGGAYQEAQSEGIVKPFEEESGIAVSEDSPLSYAKLTAMVDAGNVTWDVMEAYPYFAVQECGEHLEKIDYDVVDTTGVDEQLLSDCAVPAMKSALVLVYNAETYQGKNVPTSWEDFFDTKRFPGTRGVMNDVNQGALEVALVADGVAPDDLYPIDYDRAFAKLDTLGDDLKFIATGADQEQALTNGTVDMMLAWPGRALVAEKAGAELVPVWNQPIFYNDVWVVPKGTPNKDAAMEFLDYALRPEPQAAMAKGSGYAPINEDAEPGFTEEEQKWVPSGQDNGTGFWRSDEWWAENLEDATARWTAWSAG